MLRSSCLAWMSPPKHTLFTFRTKVRTVWPSFLALVIKLTVAGWPNVRKSYGPHAARGYHIKRVSPWFTERRTTDNWGEHERAPHYTSVFNCDFSWYDIYIYILSVVRRSVNRGDTLLTWNIAEGILKKRGQSELYSKSSTSVEYNSLYAAITIYHSFTSVPSKPRCHANTATLETPRCSTCSERFPGSLSPKA